MSKLPSVTVIGAGIAGLSAAYYLRKAGFNVQVLESQTGPGGRMAERREGNIHYNTGARLIYPTGSELWELIDNLELRSTLTPIKGLGSLCHDEKNHPYSIKLFPGLNFLSLHVLGLSDKFNLLKFGAELFLVKRQMDPSRIYSALEYDNESLADFIKRKAGPNVLKYLIEPVFRATRSWNPEDISAAFFMSTVPCLIGHTTAYAFRDGIGQLTKTLAGYLDVKYGVKVLSLERRPESGQCRIVYLKNETEKHCCSDIVVCAVEGSCLGEMVTGKTVDEEGFFNSIRYNSVGIVHYLVNSELEPHMQFSLRKERQLAVYQQTPLKDKDEKPAVKIHCQLNPEMIEMAIKQGRQDTLDDIIRDSVRDLYPAIDEHITEIVNQWIEYRIPVPYPGYAGKISEFLQYQKATKQRIYYCGDYLSQPLVNGACASGVETAGLIAQHWS